MINTACGTQALLSLRAVTTAHKDMLLPSHRLGTTFVLHPPLQAAQQELSKSEVSLADARKQMEKTQNALNSSEQQVKEITQKHTAEVQVRHGIYQYIDYCCGRGIMSTLIIVHPFNTHFMNS